MNNNVFTNLSASLINDLLSQTELTPKSLTTIIADLLSQAELAPESPIAVMSDLLSQAELASNALNALPEFTLYRGSFDFLKEINFQEDFIELTEDDCNSINILLKSSNSTNVLPKVSKGKIKLGDFIKTILIPILAILLPMLQNSYNNKMASIESQKEHIQEQEYQTQVMQTLSDILNSLETIPESQESHPCTCSDAPTPQDEESPDAPDIQSHNAVSE